MDESDQIHDARELDRLVRFMVRKGRRFGLALATYNDATVAARAREHATHRAATSATRVATIALSESGDDMVDWIASQSRTNDVIFVVGLEQLALGVDGRGPRAPLIGDLNLRRDDLPERVDARVVFWVESQAYPQLAKLAWDLLDVMLTRFEFRERRLDVGEGGRDRPAWIRLDTSANLEQLELQARSLAKTAENATNELTAADAAASAGQLYAAVGHLDHATTLLELAAAKYEHAWHESDEPGRAAAAAHTRRQLAELWFVRGSAHRARGEAERALELIAEAAAAIGLSGRETLHDTGSDAPKVAGSLESLLRRERGLCDEVLQKLPTNQASCRAITKPRSS